MTNRLDQQFKYLGLFIAIFMTVSFLTIVLIYKLVQIGPVYASAATFIIPFWYSLSDMISEIYGYRVARNLIWTMLFCEIIFIFSIVGFIYLPSPVFLDHSKEYLDLFGKLPRVFLGSFSAVLCGAFLNIYCISKWKILTRGRYFWIRSVASSAIGELVFTILAFLIEFIGAIPFEKILELMLVSYAIKILFSMIFATPATFLTAIVQKSEGVNIYDENINFNPFGVSLGKSSKFDFSKEKDQLAS